MLKRCVKIPTRSIRSIRTPQHPFRAFSASSNSTMDPFDWESFRTLGKEMVDYIADYHKRLESMPVRSQVTPGYLKPQLDDKAPEEGSTDLTSMLKEVDEKIMPGITHWQHPSFFAYFPANCSVPGILGEMLCSMFNVIAFSWVASPAATEMETVVMDWLGQLIGLPEDFLSKGTGGGVIQGTASEASLVALLAARARILRQQSQSTEAKEEESPIRSTSIDPSLWSRITAYTSDQAHSSIQKACMVAGVPLSNFHALKTKEEDGYRLSAEALEAAIKADLEKGNLPAFCCASLGTTSSGVFDDLKAIGAVCKKYGLWLHVDAAWAGASFVCPELRGPLEGIELADSFDFNPHKWLLTNFECSTMWVKHRKALLDALSLTPEYLKSKEYEEGLVYDYRDWQIPLGRKFASLKLWFVMKMFGSKRLQTYIRTHCELAEKLGERIEKDDRFEVAHKLSLSLVCFRLKGTDEENLAFLERVNATGKAFMVHSKIDGRIFLRCAVGNPKTEERHIDELWQLLCEHAKP